MAPSKPEMIASSIWKIIKALHASAFDAGNLNSFYVVYAVHKL